MINSKFQLDKLEQRLCVEDPGMIDRYRYYREVTRAKFGIMPENEAPNVLTSKSHYSINQSRISENINRKELEDTKSVHSKVSRGSLKSQQLNQENNAQGNYQFSRSPSPIKSPEQVEVNYQEGSAEKSLPLKEDQDKFNDILIGKTKQEKLFKKKAKTVLDSRGNPPPILMNTSNTFNDLFSNPQMEYGEREKKITGINNFLNHSTNQTQPNNINPDSVNINNLNMNQMLKQQNNINNNHYNKELTQGNIYPESQSQNNLVSIKTNNKYNLQPGTVNNYGMNNYNQSNPNNRAVVGTHNTQPVNLVSQANHQINTNFSSSNLPIPTKSPQPMNYQNHKQNTVSNLPIQPNMLNRPMSNMQKFIMQIMYDSTSFKTRINLDPRLEFFSALSSFFNSLMKKTEPIAELKFLNEISSSLDIIKIKSFQVSPNLVKFFSKVYYEIFETVKYKCSSCGFSSKSHEIFWDHKYLHFYESRLTMTKSKKDLRKPCLSKSKWLGSCHSVHLKETIDNQQESSQNKIKNLGKKVEYSSSLEVARSYLRKKMNLETNNEILDKFEDAYQDNLIESEENIYPANNKDNLLCAFCKAAFEKQYLFKYDYWFYVNIVKANNHSEIFFTEGFLKSMNLNIDRIFVHTHCLDSFMLTAKVFKDKKSVVIGNKFIKIV
eukprot:CAMPEP_0170534430 /NCGR_PEP_ID=MMETSP0209-20121228/91275_1 /TAXON_ID=665100 ORGANISM="Litonotus pictus, Strain P1" /NCGR_SAMPLE_ID=MMETSP0209 /ASSEMBLY_ACC=CAM_ASM_000301 /LENGTH=662 /DNA_ID=CAMNT_0010833817 /DNA_START=523 /DNA_END=2507 /DNA_ORIENTATION=+